MDFIRNSLQIIKSNLIKCNIYFVKMTILDKKLFINLNYFSSFLKLPEVRNELFHMNSFPWIVGP